MTAVARRDPCPLPLRRPTPPAVGPGARSAPVRRVRLRRPSRPRRRAGRRHRPGRPRHRASVGASSGRSVVTTSWSVDDRRSATPRVLWPTLRFGRFGRRGCSRRGPLARSGVGAPPGSGRATRFAPTTPSRTTTAPTDRAMATAEVERERTVSSPPARTRCPSGLTSVTSISEVTRGACRHVDVDGVGGVVEHAQRREGRPAGRALHVGGFAGGARGLGGRHGEAELVARELHHHRHRVRGVAQHGDGHAGRAGGEADGVGPHRQAAELCVRGRTRTRPRPPAAGGPTSRLDSAARSRSPVDWAAAAPAAVPATALANAAWRLAPGARRGPVSPGSTSVPRGGRECGLAVGAHRDLGEELVEGDRLDHRVALQARQEGRDEGGIGRPRRRGHGHHTAGAGLPPGPTRLGTS